MFLSDKMLLRASQLVNVYPYARRTDINKNVITAAAISQALVEYTPIKNIAQLGFSDRYDLIHHIQQGILDTHPAPDDNPYQPIEEQKISDKIEAIAKVSDTLRLSDNYTDFIIHVSRNASLDLAESTVEARRLLEWSWKENSQKIKFCGDIHARFMGHLQNGFRSVSLYEAFIQTAKPVPIYSKDIKPTMSLNGKSIVSCAAGFAFTNLNTGPETAYMLANTNPHGMLNTPENATNLTVHESSHIAEGIFAFTYGHHPDFVPEEFKWDAQLLYTLHQRKGYISPRLPSIYEEQANERVANVAGETARAVIKKQLNDITNGYRATPPASYPLTSAINSTPLAPL